LSDSENLLSFTKKTMNPITSTENRSPSCSWSPGFRLLLGLTGFCLGLTLLFLSMRSVLNVGGFCAEGGPYQIAVHCPKGISIITPLSVLGMVICGIIAVIPSFKKGPYLIILMWSAIFISLGWNFLDFGFNPPSDGAMVVGWLVCGVIFIIMALVPLYFLASVEISRKTAALSKDDCQNSQGSAADSAINYLEILLHLIAAAVGISLGIWLFGIFT
jgi:hypothetical protein